jgi:hypothetical protein
VPAIMEMRLGICWLVQVDFDGGSNGRHDELSVDDGEQNERHRDIDDWIGLLRGDCVPTFCIVRGLSAWGNGLIIINRERGISICDANCRSIASDHF